MVSCIGTTSLTFDNVVKAGERECVYHFGVVGHLLEGLFAIWASRNIEILFRKLFDSTYCLGSDFDLYRIKVPLLLRVGFCCSIPRTEGKSWVSL